MKKNPVEFVRLYGGKPGKLSSLFSVDYGEVEKRYLAALPAIKQFHQLLEKELPMTVKRPTRKEQQTERTNQREQIAVNSAMQTLARLQSFEKELQGSAGPVARKVRSAIRDEIAFAVKDSEVYSKAAAALFAGDSPEWAQATDSAGVCAKYPFPNENEDQY